MPPALHIAAIATTGSATAVAGAGIALAQWRQALIGRGHRVELITSHEQAPAGFAACQLARERHPAVHVVVVGDGPEVAALSEALPWATFLGTVGGEVLRRVYASADIFIVATLAGDPGRRVELGARAQASVAARSWDAVVADWEGLWRELLARPTP
jgi:hypothetical protein